MYTEHVSNSETRRGGKEENESESYQNILRLCRNKTQRNTLKTAEQYGVGRNSFFAKYFLVLLAVITAYMNE
jgi:hypothetical protein